MGNGRVDFKKLEDKAKETKNSKNSGFSATTMCDEFDPSKVVDKRYSKKGPFNGFGDPITALICLDDTGSMGKIPKALLNGDLGNLMIDLKKTFNRPNENLQISFAAIGDVKTDDAPLQVTHFESDNRFADQLQKLWIEEGGGGNGGESYNLAWWYAANKTHLNYVKRDKRKGILITIGDDNVHSELSAQDVRKCLDKKYDGGTISNEVLLNAAREQYEVYHIVITDGSSYTYDNQKKRNKTKDEMDAEAKRWRDLLGPNNVLNASSNGVAVAIADIIKRHRPIGKENTNNLSEKEWERKTKENLSDDQWEEVLSYTLCPISGKYMEKPVVWNNNKRAFEREAVENYVQQYQKDPISGDKLTLSKLVLTPKLNIAELCLSYKSFFEALPEERRNRLVKSTLEDIGIKPKNNEIKSEVDPKAEKGAAANLGIFAPKPSAAAPSPVVVNPANSNANPPNLGVAHLNVDSDGIPERFKCPIDHVVMENPVFAKDGETYGESGITRWFEKHDTSPITREVLASKELTPNKGLRSEIKEWQQRVANAQKAAVADIAKAPKP